MEVFRRERDELRRFVEGEKRKKKNGEEGEEEEEEVSGFMGFALWSGFMWVDVWCVAAWVVEDGVDGCWKVHPGMGYMGVVNVGWCGIRGSMFDGWSTRIDGGLHGLTRGLRGGMRLVYVDGCMFWWSLGPASHSTSIDCDNVSLILFSP